MLENQHCPFIEVTCPYKISKEYIQRREQEKQEKYKKLTQDELGQVEYTIGEVIGIVIGSMGTIRNKTNQALKKLKLTSQKEAL